MCEWLDEAKQEEYKLEPMKAYNIKPELFLYDIKAPKYMRYYVANMKVRGSEISAKITENPMHLEDINYTIEDHYKRGLVPLSPRMYPSMPEKDGLIEKRDMALFVCANKEEIGEVLHKYITKGIERFKKEEYDPLKEKLRKAEMLIANYEDLVDKQDELNDRLNMLNPIKRIKDEGIKVGDEEIYFPYGEEGWHE